jgi:bifunctional non-homologous end joining protein LigD
MPFEQVPREYLKGARWVEPTLLAEIKYTNVTRAGILRHASFVGLRDHKLRLTFTRRFISGDLRLLVCR